MSRSSVLTFPNSPGDQAGHIPTQRRASHGPAPSLLAPGSSGFGVTPHSWRCYTTAMPTTKRRYAVLESDELKAAMELARERWPELSDSQRLSRLASAGAEALAGTREARRRALREGIRGLEPYPDDFRRELREDWPD